MSPCLKLTIGFPLVLWALLWIAPRKGETEETDE